MGNKKENKTLEAKMIRFNHNVGSGIICGIMLGLLKVRRLPFGRWNIMGLAYIEFLSINLKHK